MRHIDFLKQLFYSQDYLKDIKRPLSNKEAQTLYHWLDEIISYIGDEQATNLTIQKPLFILSSLSMNAHENKKIIDAYFDRNPFFVKKILNASYARMGYLEKDTLCNMVFSLGLLSIRPPRDWIHRFEEDTIFHMKEFNAIHFKKSIVGYAHITDSYNKSWLDAWYKQSLAFLPKINSNDLGLISESLTKVDKASGKEWIQAWERNTLDHLQQASLKQLSSFIKFYATFNFYSDDWVNHIIEESYQKLLIEKDVEMIVKFFYGLGVLGDFSHEHIVSTALSKMHEFKAHWRLKDIGTFLYGCALLDIDLKTNNKELLEDLQLFFDQHPTHVTIPLHATYGLMIANKYYNLVRATDFHISIDQAQEMENYIRSSSSPSPSQTQEQIYNMYKDFHNVEQEVWIPEILTYADLYKVDHNTIIEVDGEHHFQNGHLNTKSALKTKILEKTGYEVVRIPVKINGY